MSKTVHVLQRGFAFCGRSGVPGEWPKGHYWVGENDAEEATCSECVRVLAQVIEHRQTPITRPSKRLDEDTVVAKPKRRR